MIQIVTWTYRYKLPQNRKGRKLAEITGPIVVTPKESRRPARVGEAAAAGMEYRYKCPSERSGDIHASTPPEKAASPRSHSWRPPRRAPWDRHGGWRDTKMMRLIAMGLLALTAGTGAATAQKPFQASGRQALRLPLRSQERMSRR